MEVIECDADQFAVRHSDAVPQLLLPDPLGLLNRVARHLALGHQALDALSGRLRTAVARLRLHLTFP